MKTYNLGHIFLVLCLSLNLNAQDTPSNNNCSGARNIVLGNQIFGSLDFATNSGENTSCSLNTRDLWYSFSAPATGEVKINLSGGGIMRYSIVKDCTNYTEVACGNQGETTVNNLQSGDFYFIFIEKYTLACRGDCDLEFALTITAHTLSTNNAVINALNYYPNPIKNELIINANTKITSVKIFNVLGEQLINTKENANNTKIDFKNQPSGIYFVKVYSNNSVEDFKVFKQ